MRTKTLVAAAALSLTASVLGACGSGGGSSNSEGDYCSELKSDKTFLAGLNGNSSPDLAKLDQLFTRMHSLADHAPSDVSADWKTLDDALTTVENALKDAGIKPSDLAKLQAGQVPEGVDMAKLQALGTKLQEMDSSKVSAAADRIAKNAKDKCGVDLNNS